MIREKENDQFQVGDLVVNEDFKGIWKIEEIVIDESNQTRLHVVHTLFGLKANWWKEGGRISKAKIGDESI